MRGIGDSVAEEVKTVLILCIALIIAYLYSGSRIFLYLSVILGVLGILFKQVAHYVHLIWMLLARILSKVVPNILLIIIYYFFLFPIALLSRLFRKSDPLILRNVLNSTFVKSEKKFDRSSFLNPW
jgi:uncharacterized membrane protein